MPLLRHILSASSLEYLIKQGLIAARSAIRYQRGIILSIKKRGCLPLFFMVGTRGLLIANARVAQALISKADRDTSVSLSLVVEPPCRFKSCARQADIKRACIKQALFLSGRDERIRTSDFLHPMQALYQTELHPDNS